MSNNLSRELAKKLCKDLCATPITIGKEGLTHKDLYTNKSIKVLFDDVVEQSPLWYGEVNGYEGMTCALLTTPGKNPFDGFAPGDAFEVQCVFGFKTHNGEFEKGSVIIGFSFDWNDSDDIGSYRLKSGGKWLAMSLAQKMQIGLGFENMIQEGVLWQPSKDIPEELLENLSDLIEVD